MKKTEFDNRGISLTELLVSVSIIAILSTVAVANIHVFNKKGDINMTAQRIVSSIREAQSYALSLKEYKGNFPKGGWGVFFEKNANSYVMYADDSTGAPNKYICDDDCDPDVSTEVYQVYNLPSGIVISDIKVGGTPKEHAHILYEPPDPSIHICWGNNQCDNDTAEITILDGSESKTILVNTVGLVDIKGS